MAKKEYGARKQAILAIIKARPGISSTDVRTTYDAQTGKESGKSTVSSSLTELHGAGDVRREKVLSDNCGYFYRYWLTTSPVAAAPASQQSPLQAGKPVHMKPFNMEHARAGAPFCCRDGGEVEILKWDRKHTFCIVGLDTHDASVRRWRADGSYNEGSNVFDLVMLPLGFIDGKPVWVGDELQWNVETIKAMPSHKPADLINCTWPAPAPVYPETLMTGQDLARVDGSRMFDTVQPSYEREARLIANAALRHAIDAGQVVPVSSVNYDICEDTFLRHLQALEKTGLNTGEHAAIIRAYRTAMKEICDGVAK